MEWAIEADQEAVIHIHIPKTAGRSLNTMLRARYPADAQVDATGLPIATKLSRLSNEQRAKIMLVAGHCNYGVHSFLSRPARYLIILRDPKDRIFSLYQYILRTPSHPLHGPLNARGGSLGDFIDLADERPGHRAEIDAGQVRRVAGQLNLASLGKEEDLFEIACRHLSKDNTILGFKESFNDFLAKLVRAGILPKTPPEKTNVSPLGQDVKDHLDMLSPAQIQRLDAFCTLDERLVKYAHEIYERSTL